MRKYATAILLCLAVPVVLGTPVLLSWLGENLESPLSDLITVLSFVVPAFLIPWALRVAAHLVRYAPRRLWMIKTGLGLLLFGVCIGLLVLTSGRGHDFSDGQLGPVYGIWSGVYFLMIPAWLACAYCKPMFAPISNGTDVLDEYRLKTREFSDALLSLRTSLPIGKSDEEFGFDYIPHMLRGVEERRARFEKSSYRFLGLTIGLAIVFAAVVVVLAYVVVAEASVGTPARVRQLETDLRSLKNAQDSLSNSLSDASVMQFVDGKVRDVFGFRTLAPGGQNGSELSRGSVREKINESIRVDSTQPILQLVTEYLQTLDESAKKSLFAAQLDGLPAAIGTFLLEKKTASDRVAQFINDLEQQLVTFKAFGTDESNRFDELLRRIFVGVVVVGFLLAILRYVAGIYQEHHRQRLLADEDNRTLRRFYVAFKCSGEDSRLKAQAVRQLMAAMPALVDRPGRKAKLPANEEDGESESELLGVLQESLKLLSKKL